jgi:hypothetical protein
MRRLALLLVCCTPAAQTAWDVPNSLGAHVVFVPDDQTAVVFSEDAFFSWGLETHAVGWRQPVGPDPSIGFSPRGGWIAVAERDGKRAKITVRSMRDGSARTPIGVSAMSEYGFLHQGGVLSVSDDGKFLAVVLDVVPQQENVAIFALDSGREVFRHVGARESYQAVGVSFAPGSHTVAANTVHDVWVLDEVNGAFADVQRFDQAVHPSWTASGLALGIDRGLELWKSGSTTPFDVHDLGSFDARWAVSFDTAHVAVWSSDVVDVYRTTDGARIFTWKDSMHRGGVVCAARFVPNHFRTFLCGGDYLDVDLTLGKMVHAETFGAQGAWSKNWLHEGASFERSYLGVLSPGGRFIDLSERGELHRIERLER